MISVIIPANNEEIYIGACLDALLASDSPDADDQKVQLIVVANGCTDNTVGLARARSGAFAEKGWAFDVLDLEQGSKIAALNAGDAAARYQTLIYIDADILVSPDLIAQLAQVLDKKEPVYASGIPVVPRARSFISRQYARFWQKLPFIRNGVPGCGVYAVNATARRRWAAFPDVISDDTFVRVHFAPDERHGVPATFVWPVTEGFANLVRVRRRQDMGMEEMRRLYPDLMNRTEVTEPTRGDKLKLLFGDPLGFVVYALVALAVRSPFFMNRGAWDRGR